MHNSTLVLSDTTLFLSVTTLFLLDTTLVLSVTTLVLSERQRDDSTVRVFACQVAVVLAFVIIMYSRAYVWWPAAWDDCVVNDVHTR